MQEQDVQNNSEHVAILPLDECTIARIDPGVRRTVMWLRENGFDTTSSADGEQDRLVELHIKIVVRARWLLQAESERLATLLHEWGIHVAPMGTGEGVEIHGQYCPRTNEEQAAWMVVYGLDDKRLFGWMSINLMN